MAVTDYNVVAANNTTISGINIAEGMLPSDVNNAIRQEMADLANFILSAQFAVLQTSSYASVGAVAAATQGQFQVTDTAIVGAAPQVSGSTDSAQIMAITGGIGQLSIGLGASNTSVWVQARKNSDFSVNYGILLNPNGGIVSLGSTPSMGTNTTGLATTAYVDKRVVVAATASAGQTIATSTFTLAAFNTVVWDKFSNYTNTAGNYKFTAAVAGLYRVVTSADWTSTSAGNNFTVNIYKNGALYIQQSSNDSATNTTMPIVLEVAISLVATDYVQVYYWQDSGGNKDVLGRSFTCQLLSMQ